MLKWFMEILVGRGNEENKANFNIPPTIKGVEGRKGVSDKAQLLVHSVFSANIEPGVRL